MTWRPLAPTSFAGDGATVALLKYADLDVTVATWTPACATRYRRAQVNDYEQTQRTLGGQIPALDGLRGIAILLVAFGHFIGEYRFTTSADHAIFAVFRAGWCGVDLFFVLSGFLITGILLESKSAPNYFGAFYMRRVLRIFPLYYAFLALWFIVVAMLASKLGWSADAVGSDRQVWYWLYVSNWMVPSHEPIPALGHLWSLAVEEQFYIVWPLVVWLLTTRRLAWVCVVAVVIAPVLRSVLVAKGMASDTAYMWTPCRMDALALGGLLAIALRSPAAHRLFARYWGIALALGLIILVAIGVVHEGLAFNLTVMKTVGYTLLALTAMAAVTGSIVAPPTSILRRSLESSFLRAFGRYSYAIYILHYPFYAMAQQKLREMPAAHWLFDTRWGYAVFVVGGIACCFGIAWLSWHLFEKHFIALKRRFVARPTSDHGTSSSK